MDADYDPNPTKGEVKQAVATARTLVESGESGPPELNREELEKLGKSRRDGFEKIRDGFLGEHRDEEDAYPGFDKARDEQAATILGSVGASSTPNDIMVLPANTGMGAANPAVTILSDDKIIEFRLVVIRNYGPSTIASEKKPHYGRLLERIQIGSVLLPMSVFDDGFRANGIIWHEAGHKVLSQKAEAGEVFRFELDHIGDRYPDRLYEWCRTVRGPAYFRTYGLRIEPGRLALVTKLQQIFPEAEFYREFAKEYEAIVGTPLAMPAAVAEEVEQRKRLEEAQKATASSLGIGDVISGPVDQLKGRLPKADTIRGNDKFVPVDPAEWPDSTPPIGCQMKFAKRLWRVKAKESIEQTGGMKTLFYELEYLGPAQ